jgi:23S rRNA-/tRNA-specific pseudouridylate synthase
LARLALDMSLGKRAALTILVGATTTALLALWRRHRRRRLQQALLASAEAPRTVTAAATASTAEASTRPIDSCREWGLTELAALHYSADYIFVYKQYDLHMDHAAVPVTLATQMMEAYPTLADAKTAFGFRHVHQLDFATSGVLCIALNKKAAGVAGKLFEKRTVSKR